MEQQRIAGGRTGGQLVADVALAVLVGFGSLVAARMGLVDWSRQDPWTENSHGPPWSGDDAALPWTVFPVLLLIMVGVALRRRWPRLAFGAVVLGTTGYLALGHPVGPVLLAPALGLLALARDTASSTWVRLMPLVLPMLLVGVLAADPAGFAEVGTWRAVVGGSMFLGLAALVGVLRRNRADARRRVRVEELGRTAYEERLRIAREVHDVVGHNLSVISMQAGAALHVLDRRPDQVADALRAIRRSSHGALSELRSTLDVFHGADPDGPRAPEPGLAQLAALTAPLAELDRPVLITVDGVDGADPPTLPAVVDHAAFRIIQEALTNILRHVPDAGAAVEIATTSKELVLTVVDRAEPPVRAPEPVPGHGIAGMRERARAVGGTLEVTTSAGRVVVRAHLPLGAGDATQQAGHGNGPDATEEGEDP